MKYKSGLNVKEFLLQINAKLKGVEVKGDSVEMLFVSEIMLKQLYDSIEEVQEEAQEEVKE